MNRFTIESNNFLSQNIEAFYHTDYIGHRKPGNPDYINTLKNTYNSFSASMLNDAVSNLKSILIEDWNSDSLVWSLHCPLAICVVLRAKTNYSTNQLLFKTTISFIVKQMNDEWWGGSDSQDAFLDGTDYIIRHTNIKTTHLPTNTPNYNNDGATPYPGITKDTCNFSSNIRGKHILLIDDLYTRTVNIDEDAIQALLDNGVLSVIFYAVGKTVFNR